MMNVTDIAKVIERSNPHLISSNKNYTGIKYINFDYDNRSQTIWKVTFRCWGKKIEFTNTNKPMEERSSLFGKIMEWMDDQFPEKEEE